MTQRFGLVAVLVALALVTIALPGAAAQSALAQPEELWEEFPLDSDKSPPPEPEGRQSPAPEESEAAPQTPARVEAERASDGSGGDGLSLWLLPGLGVLAFLGGIFAAKAALGLARRRREAGRGREGHARVEPTPARAGTAEPHSTRRSLGAIGVGPAPAVAMSAANGRTRNGSEPAAHTRATQPAPEVVEPTPREQPTPSPIEPARTEQRSRDVAEPTHTDPSPALSGVPQEAEEPTLEVAEPTGAKAPTPDAVEPTPDVVEPTPDVGEPTPDVGEPTPDVVEPTPDVGEPTPDAVEPTETQPSPPEAPTPVVAEQPAPQSTATEKEPAPPAAAPAAAQQVKPEGREPAQRKPLEALPDDVIPFPTRGRMGKRPAPSAPQRALGYVSAADAESQVADLEAQAEEIRSACVRNGFDSVEVVRDFESHSGSDLERPGLSYAIERLEAGEATCLVVTSLERLTRSAAHLGTLIERLGESGIRLVVLDIQLDTGDRDGSLAAAALANVGTLERKSLDMRTRKGLQAARDSRRSSGRPAVADRPALKERIADMRSRGMTLQAIADTLNAEGVPTLRGGAEWRPSSVQAAVGYKRPKRGARKPADGSADNGGERNGGSGA